MIRLLLFALLFTTSAVADNVFMDNTTSESNMCVIGITGQTTSNPAAVARATYSPITYTCSPGTYLPAGNDWTSDTQYDNGCATCPAGSYCIGGDYTYNATTAQGATLCSAMYSGTTSAAGATSVNACYLANVSCPTISGATACDPHAATCSYTSQTTSGNYYLETATYTGSCAMDFTCATGYTKSTTQNTPTLPNQNGNSIEYHSHNNNNVSSNGSSMAAGSWSVTWTSGTTTGTMGGIASCNNVPGNTDNYAYTTPSTLPANSNLASTSTTGRYCWCKPTTWTPSGGSATNLSAAWVFNYDNGGAGSCASRCADRCASNVRNNSGIRSALFSLIGASAQCIANTITIDWSGYGAGNNQTQQTQCTYGGSITTPTDAPTKRGHVFVGWTFDLGN